ncbi:YjzC family protein [Gracilibacillus caseinilyticus]|uniref:YjzC family protein n=1 Tax=Gracilibacillus caseinilyticus TaxID=2932256 RepID=A0ABY4F205_9BACI|nr:YjzC family protein [Gracilibacillus caseinilyticus]UOQ50524.1 YjzC family protein [Gracilibacillus caseinilyticus]
MQRFKTGEKAPEAGIYKVEKLTSDYQSEDYFNDTTIELAEGETFPPAPAEDESAWWVRVPQE